MNRTKILIWQRDRVPTWLLMVVMATAVALSLMWGVNPAAADTAPASTPTVAPTTVAPTTVAPVATAAPEASSGTVRIRAQVPGDQCPAGTFPASDSYYSVACPLEMKLVHSFADIVPGAETNYRVGDVVKVEIRVINHATSTFSFNGVSAHVDFDTTEVRLVKADAVPVPVSTPVGGSQNVNGGIVSPAASITGYVFKNYYSKSGATGQIDFEAGASGTGGQTPTAFAAVQVPTGSTGTLIGTFHVRVLENPVADVTYTLSLRASNASAGGSGDSARNSVVTGADPANAQASFPGNVGYNVMAMTTDAVVQVVETRVAFSLVAATPTFGIARRVGDVVPVQIKLNPVTRANYIDTVRTKITFDTREFNLVTGPATDDAGKQPVSMNPVKFTAGDAFVMATTNAGGVATNTYTLDATSNTGTIELNITGTRQQLAASTSGTTDHAVIIGTFYVRPLMKTITAAGDDPLDIAFSNTASAHVAGERQLTTDFGPRIDFTVTTFAAGATTTVPNVLGTVGVSLKAQSPLASATFSPLSQTGTATFAWASPTFTVVDGRYLDVQVTVNAAGTDSLKVDRMSIDIAFDPAQLDFNATVASSYPMGGATGSGHELNASIGIAASGTYAVTLAANKVNLTLLSGSLLVSPFEVARLRFKVKTTQADDVSQIVLNVADTTTLSQSAGNLFVTDFYADPLPSAPNKGEFDQATTITRQRPSTLQIGAILQGRRATSPSTRFVQPMAIELRKDVSAGGKPVERHLTQNTTPASVKQTVAGNTPGGPNPVSTMVYGKNTMQSSTTPTFAVLEGSHLAEPLDDLEPGTYDVYIKGQSSIAVLVTSVQLLPGQLRSVSNFVLREGDIDHNDVVNGADFSSFTPGYNSVASPTYTLADFNQSNFVDMLDFSLLASNFTSSVTGPDVLAAGSGAVQVNRLRPSGTYTMPTIAMTPATTDYAIGDVVPVTVTLNPGSRPVDGAQIVVRAGNGAELVGSNTFEIEPASPLSVLFSDAVNAGRNLIELALGRQPRATPVSGPTVLGTVNVLITGNVTGDLLTIDANGNGQFATMIAGGGENLLDPATYGYVAPVSEPIVSGSTSVTTGGGSSAPARAAAPAPTGPRASLPATRASVSRAISEDTVRGIVSVAIPGRAPVELRTGLATSVPDAYCPTVRHNTYIRLEDVGIAGATFGVEPGGVLSWVSPDQAGCVNWTAISEGGLTFSKEIIMQFQLARAVPGALLWVLDGARNGELYEVDASGTATYITGDAFKANQDHFTKVWANVIPVSTSQVDGLASRGAVSR